MNFSRRTFLKQSAAALAASASASFGASMPASSKIRVGACVVGLQAAKEAGLDGVQVGVGNAADELDIFKAERQAKYREQMQATGLPICSFMMGLLNNFPLASDPRGPAWLAQSIDAAKALGVSNILVAFFGKGDLQSGKKINEEAFAAAVKRLKEAAPRAKDAGVSLAVENMLSAEQNLRLLDAVNHEAVSLYYDVYNTGKTQKFDSPAEIRRLKGRITQFHYKNGPAYLDADTPYFQAITAAIKEIDYRGWIVLETSAPSKNGTADARRNGEFVRSLFS
jgi:sugar phosphate isomerase/epimerase